MTDTDCLWNCPPSSLMMLSTFLWMRESYFRHGRVFVVAVPALQISGCESRVASLSRKIFSPSDVCGGVSRCRDSPGECGRRLARVRILEIMGLRSVWEHIGMVSRGWGQHRSDISPSSSHPPHPWARPGSVLFCIIIIIITRLSHRPASSAGVTGPREPVPKQYQENKSEDQL